jgi:hypothetical protein
MSGVHRISSLWTAIRDAQLVSRHQMMAHYVSGDASRIVGLTLRDPSF